MEREVKIDADGVFDFLMKYANPQYVALRKAYCQATEEQRHIMYEPYGLIQSVYYALPEDVMNEFRQYESNADYGTWIKLWEQLRYPESQYAALMCVQDKCFMEGLYSYIDKEDAFRIDKANLILFEWFEKVKRDGAHLAEQIRIVEQQRNKIQQDVEKAKQDYDDWKNCLHGIITQHLAEYIKCGGDMALVKWSNNVHDIDYLRGNVIRESKVFAASQMRDCILGVINADKLNEDSNSFDEYVFLLAALLKEETPDKGKLKNIVGNCLKWLKDENYKKSCNLSDQLTYKCEVIAHAWSIVSGKDGSKEDDILKKWREWHIHYEGWNKPHDEYHYTVFNIILLYIMILVTVMEGHFDNSKQQEDYLLWITNAIIRQYNSCQENSVLATMYLGPLSLVMCVTDKSFPQLQNQIYGQIVEAITPIYNMLSTVENNQDSLTNDVRQRIIERYDEEQSLWTPIMESRNQRLVMERQKKFVDELRRSLTTR